MRKSGKLATAVRVAAPLLLLTIFLRVTPNLLRTCFEISGKCSLSVEPPEQIALFTTLWADDIVLELGGNIGTSCIAAARMGSRVLCTEPNPELWTALAANREATGTTYEILRGVVQPRCDNKSVPIFVVGQMWSSMDVGRDVHRGAVGTQSY